MRRVGAKGEGRFERITWDEALDTIADRFSRISASEDGPEAILPYRAGGTLGIVNGSSMDRRFFNRLGASQLALTICAAAGSEAMVSTVGEVVGTDMENFKYARLIILWGTNTLSTNVHLWTMIKLAKEKGAKVIGIDPYRTHTMDHCDQHIQIRPGTDAALALAMMNVIISRGLEDRDYIERYTTGFDRLRDRIAEFPPAVASEICGLTKEEITNLAVEYATTRPAAIRTNYGMQRHAGGGMAVRSIACLPALVGSWRDAGGGVLFATGGIFKLNEEALHRPDLRRGNPRTINMTRLGEALTDSRKPVRALYVYNSNPAAVAPDQLRVESGLQRADLFTVVHDQFQTDTADYADILLPATTQLEHKDMVRPYGHYYLVYNEPAIAPLGEAKPNFEVFKLLAERMGFKESCFKDTEEEIIRQALSSSDPALQGITLEQLKRDGWARLRFPEPFTPFAEGGFFTPSGKCEFYSERLEQAGIDPLPAYIASRESAEASPALAARYPIRLLCPIARTFLNTSFSHLESFLKSERQPMVIINPVDADSRQIKDGDLLRVWNDRGECTLVAQVSTRVKQGVAVAPSTWWKKLSPGHHNVNVTTSQALTDLGGGATFYDNLVEIAKAGPLATA
jgi:anaerobic selenocysteine-containing dehydrogenase